MQPDFNLKSLFCQLSKTLLEAQNEKVQFLKKHGDALSPEVREELRNLNKKIKNFEQHLDSIKNII